MKIYSIKDVKAGFEPVFCRANDELAKRDFISAFKFGSQPNRFQQFPADYELWYIGEMNDKSGQIVSEPQFLMNLSEVSFNGVQDSI